MPATLETLRLRQRFFRAIQTFFDSRDFLEVQTPSLVPNPGLEPHLMHFESRLLAGMGIPKERTLYLATSPEYHLKRALAELNFPRVFEIARSYRNGELGRTHQPEFHMLEWYRHPGTYQEIAADFGELLKFLAQELGASEKWKELRHIRVEEAFSSLAGIQLRACLEGKQNLADAARAQGIIPLQEDFSTCFNQIIIEKIEPHLGFNGPEFLWDYPASEAALSRKKASDPLFCERIEVYWRGVELANAFGELTEEAEQRARCESDIELRQKMYGTSPPLDELFLKGLKQLHSPAGGIAVGLDRLLMCLLEFSSLEEVIAFPHPN
jgi:lysyl-tRNA synthetase class 2